MKKLNLFILLVSLLTLNSCQEHVDTVSLYLRNTSNYDNILLIDTLGRETILPQGQLFFLCQYQIHTKDEISGQPASKSLADLKSEFKATSGSWIESYYDNILQLKYICVDDSLYEYSVDQRDWDFEKFPYSVFQEKNFLAEENKEYKCYYYYVYSLSDEEMKKILAQGTYVGLYSKLKE